MEVSIYVDNARGFQDCLVSLERTSFLVGENSSGKSSFLALAHILSSEDFWVNLGFGGFSDELGNPDDLISKASKARVDFTVGVGCRKSSSRTFSAVCTFERQSGEVRVKRCTYLHGDRVLSFMVELGSVRWLEHRVDIRSDVGVETILGVLVAAHRSLVEGVGNSVSFQTRDNDKYLLLSVSHTIKREMEKLSPAEDSGLPDLFPNDAFLNGAWFAPVRAEPRSIYQTAGDMGFSPSGLHTPYLLRNVLKKRKKGG